MQLLLLIHGLKYVLINITFSVLTLIGLVVLVGEELVPAGGHCLRADRKPVVLGGHVASAYTIFSYLERKKEREREREINESSQFF